MLSRGAERALFVEKDSRVARIIRENARELGLGEQVEVLCEDATRNKAQEAIKARGAFSLVLADPPYRDVQAAAVALEALCARGALAPDACLLLEHGAKGAPDLPKCFEVLTNYRYGDTAVILFVASPGAPSGAPTEGLVVTDDGRSARFRARGNGGEEP
jgi:16S rRNA (guanine966-N2)-methyltransferase